MIFREIRVSQSDPHSITFWIDALQDDHPEAITALWNRYFGKLVRLADKMLGERRRVLDGEDVAVSVFDALSRAATRGDLERMHDREELWRLLVTMTRRKVIDELRHDQRAKRGGGEVRGESVFLQGDGQASPGIGGVADADPTPQFLCMMDEEFRRLLDLLDDPTLRDVALARLDGCTTAEIAERTGISPRSVERKLGLIRERWQVALQRPSDPTD